MSMFRTIGLILVAVGLVGCGGTDSNKTYNVQYRVAVAKGSAIVSITTSVPGGGTEQHGDIVIPSAEKPYTSPNYTFKTAEVASISAQAKGYQDFTTEIIVDGSTLKTANASGEHSIASVNWLVGSKE